MKKKQHRDLFIAVLQSFLIGFILLSSEKLLDHAMAEHTKIEFVHIALNPIGWDSAMDQVVLCLKVRRKRVP